MFVENLTDVPGIWAAVMFLILSARLFLIVFAVSVLDPNGHSGWRSGLKLGSCRLDPDP
jgi:hypothetical protein